MVTETSDGPFIGRESELAALMRRLDAASANRGGVLLLAGEPGVGKSRLIRTFLEQVEGRGVTALTGQAYESAGTPPYLPFIEALRDHVRSCPPELLRAQVGDGAHRVAMLLRELATRFPDLTRGPTGSSEAERYELFESMTDFMLRIAHSNTNGLVVCLDDLHWAGSPTLMLFKHLARKLTHAPVVLVGAYRTVDIDPADPLADFLADLTRERLCERLTLSAFSRDEVATCVARLWGAAPSQSVVDAVYQTTEGNPFFVEEVVRHLRTDGLDPTATGVRSDRWRVPEGVRQVLAQRISRISPTALHLLQAGAVLGDRFTFELIEEMHRPGDPPGPGEPALLDALDEALRAGLVSQDHTGYQFHHALVRQAIQADLSLPRQQRLHLRAGEAIEQRFPMNLEPYVAELAFHFFQAALTGGAAKAVAYAQRAAERAQRVCAYEEVVRFCDMGLMALDLAPVGDPARRCDLLLVLGQAQMALGRPGQVAQEVAPEILALAEGISDRERASLACRLALEGLHRESPFNTEQLVWREWATRADRYAPPGGVDRAYADIALARVAIGAGRLEEGIALLEGALALARQHDDSELLFSCAWQLIRNQLTNRHWRRAVALAQECLTWHGDGVRHRTLAQCREMAGAALLTGGDRLGAELAWAELGRLGQHSQDEWIQDLVPSYRGLLATLDGHLDEAAEVIADLARRSAERGSPLDPGALARCGRALLHLGQFEQLEAYTQASSTSRFANFVALGGAHPDSQRLLTSWLATHQLDDGAPPIEFLPQLAQWLEVAVSVGDRHAAELLTGWLGDAPVMVASGFVSCVGRHLGAAAALQGERSQARELLDSALLAATDLRVRPEIALLRLQLAELLLEEYGELCDSPIAAHPARPPTSESPGTNAEAIRAEAFEHLDFAVEELRAMQMGPTVARALRLRDRHTHPSPDTIRRILPAGLSEREVEVLRLIAAGRSNQQIADELVISLNTVTHHVTHNFAKTGATNRTEAAGFATRHGLV